MEQALIKYFNSTEIIDYNNPLVFKKAKQIALNSNDIIDIVKKSYTYVRDKIYHCVDFDMNPVTCKASDVLIHKTGFGYAKSHLLVALLRANSIPAGLCYQRIAFNEFNHPYCLHGLVAVYIPEFGWYRIDPRGNKAGINAQFNPPNECLAYNNSLPGEYIFPKIWDEPLNFVKKLLTKYSDYKEALKNFPDVEAISITN